MLGAGGTNWGFGGDGDGVVEGTKQRKGYTEKEPGWLKTLHTEELKLFPSSSGQPSIVTVRFSFWKIQWLGSELRHQFH